MIYALMAMFLQPNPITTVREPKSASPWVQSVTANCGGDMIEISGYGAARPLDAVARLRVNGADVTGDAAGQLRADLSNRRAAYRLEITCGDAGEIWVRISEGEKPANGPVRFRFSAASIKDGLLRSYSGLQEGAADDFWFR